MVGRVSIAQELEADQGIQSTDPRGQQREVQGRGYVQDQSDRNAA